MGMGMTLVCQWELNCMVPSDWTIDHDHDHDHQTLCFASRTAMKSAFRDRRETWLLKYHI